MNQPEVNPALVLEILVAKAKQNPALAETLEAAFWQAAYIQKTEGDEKNGDVE